MLIMNFLTVYCRLLWFSCCNILLLSFIKFQSLRRLHCQQGFYVQNELCLNSSTTSLFLMHLIGIKPKDGPLNCLHSKSFLHLKATHSVLSLRKYLHQLEYIKNGKRSPRGKVPSALHSLTLKRCNHGKATKGLTSLLSHAITGVQEPPLSF